MRKIFKVFYICGREALSKRMAKPTTEKENTRERIMIKMTVAEALEQLGNEHKGKQIKMANRFGYWWNYWNEEVAVIRTNNKYIFITIK